MAISLDKARTIARVTPGNPRAQSIHQNLHRKVPHRAQLAHLWSLWGDESACDGCGQMIELDDIEYELQFGQGQEAVTIRMHRDCWESWRARKLRPEGALMMPLGHASTRRSEPAKADVDTLGYERSGPTEKRAGPASRG